MPTIRRHARWWLVLILLVLLLAAGCQPREELVFPMDPALADRSLVTGEPCAPPCWYGLVPDVSSEAEVISTLQTLPFVDASTITVAQESSTLYPDERVLRFGCQYPGGSAECGAATFSGERLKTMGVWLQIPVTLETVVERWGPPEYVTYGPVSPERAECFLTFVWPAAQFVVHRLVISSGRACDKLREGQGVERTLILDGVGYRAPDRFASYKKGSRPWVAWPGFSEP